MNPTRRAERLSVVATVLAAVLFAAACTNVASTPSAPATTNSSSPAKHGSEPRRYLEDYEDIADSYPDTATAAAAVPYDAAWVGDVQGHASRGSVVINQWNGEALPSSRRPIIVFYDDFRFEQWPHATAAEAEEGLGGLASVNGATGMNLVQEVQIGPNRGYIMMADADVGSAPTPSAPKGYATQLSWVDDNMFYSVRSYGDSGVPRGLMIAVAQSVRTH